MAETIFTGFGNKPIELHHAYGIEGERDVVVAQVMNFLEEVAKFSVSGNPDFHYIKTDSFAVENARRVVDMQSKRSFSGKENRKVFVVAFSSATNEAQNALLKAVEEPSAGTHFFFVVPTISIFIPTLRSRLSLIYRKTAVRGRDEKNQAEVFLSVDKPERLAMVKKFLADVDKEGTEKEFLLEFLGNLEKEVWFKAEKGDLKEWREALECINKSRKHAAVRSVSIKMILEHISLVLPRVSV